MGPPDPSRDLLSGIFKSCGVRDQHVRGAAGQAWALLLAQTPPVLGATMGQAGGLGGWREGSPGLRGPEHHLEDSGVEGFLSQGTNYIPVPHPSVISFATPGKSLKISTFSCHVP